MSKILLESPVYTLEAALLAAEYGVDRLELCADFGEGGVTPSAGMLSYLKSTIQIPVFVMIRPRGGDFFYSEEELEVMYREIEILKSFGADGFVFGILQADGTVNTDACSALIRAAGGIPCTFHRAFDASSDMESALAAVIDCGFDRILTSGGKNTVTEGLEVIKKMMLTAGNRIIIMPGGGTEPSHLAQLHSTGYLKEVHSSCKSYRNSRSTHINPLLQEGVGNADQVLTVDKALVEGFQEEIDKLE